MPYDWESGLVFDETEKRYHGNACLQELFSVRKPKGHHVRLSTGSDKMWEMAIRLLLHNLDSLSVDALKALEIAMLERLHKIISESRLDGLPTWKLFAQTGKFNCDMIKTVQAGCVNCNPLDLKRVIKQVSSPSLSWVTNLSLDCTRVSASQLMDISHLHGLQSLYIWRDQLSEPLNGQQLIRAWAALAEQHDAFSTLQMIFLDFDVSLSAWTFYNLNKFPALDTFVTLFPLNPTLAAVQPRKHDWAAAYHGKGSAFVEHARRYKREHGDGRRMPMKEHVEAYLGSRGAHDHDKIGQLPILNVRCGEGQRRESSLKDILCFYRLDESKPQRKLAKRPSTKQQEGEQQPSKRRKLKVGKTMILDDVLAGL